MLARALLEENRTSGRAHESGPVGLGLEKGKSLGAAGFPQYLTFFAHRTTGSLNKRAAAGFREPRRGVGREESERWSGRVRGDASLQKHDVASRRPQTGNRADAAHAD